MANVIRYFSTTSAGAADGTSWANRAALIVSGAINTIITGFNFTADSLTTMIGVGTYNMVGVTGTWPAGTTGNPHYAIGCDSSGNRWRPPSWNAAMPRWDVSGMPQIELGASGGIGPSGYYYGLRIWTSAARGTLLTPSGISWCSMEHLGTNVNASALAFTGRVDNVYCRVAGSSYSAGIFNPQGNLYNVRIDGNAAATSGTRIGLVSPPNVSTRMVIANHPGGGVIPAGVGNRSDYLNSFVVYNCNEGIRINNRGASTPSYISNSIIVGNATAGIASPIAPDQCVITLNNRLRNNGFNIATAAQLNNPWDLANDFSSGTDADEFVDAANGDFQIKAGSVLFNTGIGAGDQTVSGGLIFPRSMHGGYSA